MNDHWMMGALAAQNNYKPLPWGSDPWVNRLGPTPQMIEQRKAEEASQRAAQAYADQQATNADEAQVYRGMPRLDPGIRREPGSVAATPVAQGVGEFGGELLTDPTSYLPGAIASKAGRLLVGLGTMGSVFQPDEAQAGVFDHLIKKAATSTSRARDPRMWSPVSKLKLEKPLDEMEHRYTDVRVPVPHIIHPEKLQGGYGIFPPYDLSIGNATLTHVDNSMLPRPVRAHGGVSYSEANPGQAAASELSIARRLDNQATEIMDKTGKPVYIMPMTMSPATGINASHHVADPLAQFIQQAPIKSDDLAAFNTLMRSKVKGWVDTQNDEFQHYINNLQGGMKIKALMAGLAGKGEWQAKGFPDVAKIRHAMTEPGLIDVPRNTTGMAISQYIPGQGLLPTTHPSYSKGVAGTYMGQLANLLSFEDAAPTIARALAKRNRENMKAGKETLITPAYHMGKPAPGVPTAQKFDQRWLDNIMRRWGEKVD